MQKGDLWQALICSAAIVAPAPAYANGEARQQVHLPAQRLDISLQTIGKAFGRNIGAPSDLVTSRTAPAVDGNLTFEEAVSALLRDSGLEAVPTRGGVAVRRARPALTERSDAGDDRSGIVVTGTRIRGTAPTGTRVVIIDREDIDRSGYATTQQLLQALPQNYGGGPNEASLGISTRNNATSNTGQGSGINLRGLGPTSTLTLVDGNRLALGGLFGSFTDLSLIPSTLVERIEVLADGSSALYGSDAVAGVVNVRLRNDFSGAETRGRYGFGRGFDDAQASQLFGFDWTGGRAVLAYEYYQQGRLAAADRAYATEDLTRFGGPDYRSTFSNPGTIIAANGQTFAIPAGQDGTHLTAGDLVPGVNLHDGRIDTDLLPEQRRHSLYTAVTQDIADNLTFIARGFAADRRSTRRMIPENAMAIVVPATNPFYVDPIGTGEPVMVNYAFIDDFGPQLAISHVRTYTAVGGLDYGFGDWSASLRGSYSSQTEKFRQEGVPNYPALAAALANPDPATAFNPFGDGSFTNPATIAKVGGYIHATSKFRTWSASFKVDGPLAHLPAGALKVALGAEYRREHFDYINLDNEFSASPTIIPTTGLPIGRSVGAAFAELLIPLVAPHGDVPGIRRLDLSLAGRVEHYSGLSTTANPKVGVRWEVAKGLALRGTFGTSFRAPSFQDIRVGPGTTLFIPIPIPDPASPTGSANVLFLFGNQLGLGPEKATTWNAGIDLVPEALPGLHAALTYFDVRYHDRITNIAIDFTTFLNDRTRYATIIDDQPSAALIASLYGSPFFNNPYGITQSGIAYVIDARTANLSSVRQNGIDFDLGYTLKHEGFAVDMGLSGSYLFGIKQRIAASAPTTDIVSTIGNPVDLRLRARLGLSTGRWSAFAFANYMDDYRNTAVIPNERVRSWTTVDLQLSYDFGERDDLLTGTRMSLSATNLFDRDPPYVNNRTIFSAIGYDADAASPAGRMIALQVIKPW